MPHRRRSLLRGIRVSLPAALFIAFACSPDTSADDPADTGTPAAPAQRADPAASLDAEFQRARSALNAEAEALSKLDRASPEYTTRYDAWLRDAAAAESLRARRDSLRAAEAGTPAT